MTAEALTAPMLERRTQTMVFTDIEGSTQLLARLGAHWSSVLSRHHALARDACAASGGVEIDTQGDAFFLLYDDARGAVDFAARLQRSLAAQVWPEDVDVRVRIGLHTGTVERGPTGPLGMDVHKAARVGSSAHGGQVVLTGATKELLEGVPLRDLGDHRLKDLPLPVRLWQLLGEGLAEDFPPVRSLDARRSELPPRDLPVIGRHAELTTLSGLFAQGVRLVTITGPGGTGKSTLQEEAGRRHLLDSTDGVALVRLAGVQEASAVLPAVAQALGVELEDDPVRALAAGLAKESLLLMLDNVEQVLDVAPQLAQLLDLAPALRLLVTSRAPLRIHQEHVLPLGPLPLPVADALDAATSSPAVQLFAASVARIRPGFLVDAHNVADVTALCRHLEGLPLALELAAARCRTFEPGQLLPRIAESTALLRSTARDLDPRQRSLQATIEWSVRLLPGPAQELFDGLGCFEGGASLELLESVSEARGMDPLDALESLDVLVEHSLVRPPNTEGRFTWPVPVRDAARARAEAAGTADAWSAAHRTALLQLAWSAWDAFWELDATLLPELDNLRRALATAEAQDPACYAVLAGAAANWLAGEDRHEEAYAHLQRAMLLPDLDARTQATVLEAAADVATRVGLGAESPVLLDRSISLWRACGDPVALARALSDRCMIDDSADLDVAALTDEAISLLRAANRQDLMIHAVGARAQVLIARGDPAGAAEVLAQLDQLPVSAQAETWARALVLHFTADCHLLLGAGEAAVHAYGASVRHALGLGKLGQVAIEIEGLSQALAVTGSALRSLELLEGVALLRRSLGMDVVTAFTWWNAMIERNVHARLSSLPEEDLAAARARAASRGPEGVVALALELSAEATV